MEELVKKVAVFIEEKQGSKVGIYDARSGALADYYVIFSAKNKRHLKAVAKDLEKFVEDQGLPLYIRQGTEEGGWIILDFYDVIIHCFEPETREFYHLERLWEAMRI